VKRFLCEAGPLTNLCASWLNMDRSIFRDVALERLSSPDELDRLLKVTDSKAWIAQLAAFTLIALALVWAYTGRIPSVVSGQGVIVRRGGVLNVVAAGSGVATGIIFDSIIPSTGTRSPGGDGSFFDVGSGGRLLFASPRNGPDEIALPSNFPFVCHCPAYARAGVELPDFSLQFSITREKI
jgi:hypothetical protein